MKGIIEDPFRKRIIEHVTLPRASSRSFGRSEVDEDVLESLRRDVLPALDAGNVVAVPGRPGYRLRLRHSLDGAYSVFLESDAGTELLTIGIGWSDPGAAGAWREITGETDEPIRPWVANVLSLKPLMALYDEGMTVAKWSATLARSLAWAVLPEAKRTP